MRFNPAQNSFVAGELSPRLEGRDDLEQYHQGLRQSVNGLVLPHGGWQRRSGTKFISEVRLSSQAARIIPFVFSTTEAYVIVINNGFLRYFVNGAPLVSVGAFSDGALFTDGGGFADVGLPIEDVAPWSQTELKDIQYAQTGNFLYLVHPAHPPQRLRRLSSTNFNLIPVNWSGGKAPLLATNDETTTITATGGPTYTLTASANLWDFTGGTDVGRAVRSAGGANEGWFEITSVTSPTVALATLESGVAPTGAQTNWALGMFSDNEGARSIAFHENRLWFAGCPRDGERVAGSDSGLYQKFSADVTLDDNAIYVSTATTGELQTAQWLVSAQSSLWVGTSSGEGVVTSADDAVLTPGSARFKARTQSGSVHVQPAIAGSDITFIQKDGRGLRRIGFELASDRFGATDIGILAEHILRDGGIEEMQYQQNPNRIIWLVRGDGTLVGFTVEPEQRVIGAHRHIIGGVSNRRGTPAVVESIAVIPAPDQQSDQVWMVVLRRINNVNERYVELMQPDFRSLLTPMATTTERIDALQDAWFLDSALEVNNPITITAITQALPGQVTTDTAHGLADGDRVQIRGTAGMEELDRRLFTVNNASTFTFTLQTVQAIPVGVDTTGFTAYINLGFVRKVFTTVSGLTHLEGETVSILADQAEHADKVVTSGAITLDRDTARVLIGLHRKAFGETQRFVGGGRLGSDKGQVARAQRAVLRLHDTVAASVGVGPQPAQLSDIVFREGDWEMDAPPPLFAGDRDISLDGGWSDTPTIYFEQDTPLPFTLLSIMPRAQSGER